MEALKEKIISEGKILPGDILKVDNFLNHQIDVAFLDDIGHEFYERFKDCQVDKILTIEASGIAIAVAASRWFGNLPVVFAKKGSAGNMEDFYSVTERSYTRNMMVDVRVAKQYLNKGEKILILDDFLATGEALEALISLCHMAGCEVIGCGTVIEKDYQGGGNKLREKAYKVESLARIASMSPEDGIRFI